MSITDKLREIIPEIDFATNRDRLRAIADLIDMKHEQGRETCRFILHGYLADQPSIACWSCAECSFGWHHSIYDKQFSYCPNCGRKVVDA